MSDKAPRILIVDDEEPNLALMKARLSPMGYELNYARDGIEAIEKVHQQEPDVILLDLIMPKLDGFEVASQLKENDRFRLIPIVVVSGTEDEKSRVKALEIGVDDFLSKPVNFSELIARIRSSLKIKAYNSHMKSYQEELEAKVAQRTELLKNANEKIKSGSLETIHRLTSAAEYRDEDTGGHIKRLSIYAAIVARMLGLEEHFAEKILYASPLHDIGKIGIPDRILLKPGKLDDEEWELMKKHTLIGSKILENSTFEHLKLGEIIARTHHEKWDGSGYPRGLEGDHIPLAGRITAIVDVFDALTTQRPYKPAFSKEKSFAIIKEGRGGHFDPEVVDAFFAAQNEILCVKEKYKDTGQSLLYESSR